VYETQYVGVCVCVYASVYTDVPPLSAAHRIKKGGLQTKFDRKTSNSDLEYRHGLLSIDGVSTFRNLNARIYVLFSLKYEIRWFLDAKGELLGNRLLVIFNELSG